MILSDNVKYDKRFVAFIDILGFKEIIKNSGSDNSKIQLIHSVLTDLKNLESSDKWNLKLIEIEEDAFKKGIENFNIQDKINVTAFSDSIVVSVKIDDGKSNEYFSTLISQLSYIGSVLIEKGILFRGGITIGELYHNSQGTVFGQGLIDAYQLESKSAKYPRIILSDSLIRELNYPLKSKRERYPYHQYLTRFTDGCVGFHQMVYYEVMETWVEITKEKLIASLDKVRKVIIAGLDSSFENPEVFDKFNWLKTKYQELNITLDHDFESQSKENIKYQLRELNENMLSDQNIHYKNTDDFFEVQRKQKGNTTIN